MMPALKERPHYIPNKSNLQVRLCPEHGMQLNYTKNRNAIAEQQEKAKKRRREDTSPKAGNDAQSQRLSAGNPVKGIKQRLEEGKFQFSESCMALSTSVPYTCASLGHGTTLNIVLQVVGSARRRSLCQRLPKTLRQKLTISWINCFFDYWEKGFDITLSFLAHGLHLELRSSTEAKKRIAANK